MLDSLYLTVCTIRYWHSFITLLSSSLVPYRYDTAHVYRLRFIFILLDAAAAAALVYRSTERYIPRDLFCLVFRPAGKMTSRRRKCAVSSSSSGRITKIGRISAQLLFIIPRTLLCAAAAAAVVSHV
jgi:hypothetical protein